MKKSAWLAIMALFPLHIFASDLVDREDVIQSNKTNFLETSLNQNNKAQRVVVFFNVYNNNDGLGDFHCPVRVRVVDNLCGTQTDDPGVACRDPGPKTGKHPTISKIKWRARGESYNDSQGKPVKPKFTVTFKNGLEPCVSDDTQGWSGSRKAREKQVCLLKDNTFFSGPGDNYIKYDIVGSEKRCNALDPYFIVRN